MAFGTHKNHYKPFGNCTKFKAKGEAIHFYMYSVSRATFSSKKVFCALTHGVVRFVPNVLSKLLRSFCMMVPKAKSQNKNNHTMRKAMKNWTRKWCLFLGSILFEVTWAFWKMWPQNRKKSLTLRYKKGANLPHIEFSRSKAKERKSQIGKTHISGLKIIVIRVWAMR